MNSVELEHIVDKYGEHLLKMAYFYLRDPETAKDIAQEVFITFMRSRTIKNKENYVLI
ncbi:RNA polymerase sigma factor [Sporosarcina sp. P16b]|uniref:RNA polymerase sigma factor n=1 Tax=Sporosarcina sp. P16b TaxID=2048261 RepID=UPI0011817B89|nr:sigma factor [Sporosarcina sp. P16b]